MDTTSQLDQSFPLPTSSVILFKDSVLIFEEGIIKHPSGGAGSTDTIAVPLDSGHRWLLPSTEPHTDPGRSQRSTWVLQDRFAMFTPRDLEET